jgi:hypothetical protein
MRLTLLHTAQVHCATFDALRDRIAPGVEINHVVRRDFLERAQDGISPELSTEIAKVIAAASDTVICTCTTIGPTAAAAGAIRVDQPMMQAAADAGGPVVMAYCLDSTLKPSLELLTSAMQTAGNRSEIILLHLLDLWPLFEAGNGDAFAHAIADAIRRANIPAKATIVLAQASMTGAAALLADLGVPVLSSPELAFCSALAEI